jgi:triphosphatase
MQRELEIKVELSKADVERLGGQLLVGDLSVGPAETKKLRTVYFHTPRYDLHAAGISLRLRRQNGGWLQTVKADQHVANGVSNPIELEAPSPARNPTSPRLPTRRSARHRESRARNHTASRV